MSAQLKHHCWDTLITNALVFDGSGDLPQEIDIAIENGQIVAKGLHLDPDLASKVVNAEGKWLMPGLMDIHTHMDLEIEIAPGLPELVRHGTTTVLIGNCSLGISFGKQEANGQNPIVDCFTRVENIPKPVLQKVVDVISWNTTAEYLDHLEEVNLGANVAVLLPHSMLRIEAMGLQNSVTRLPEETELKNMEALLNKAIDEGYVGMSTDGLPFHYLALEPNLNSRIPTQHASHQELKRLLNVLRTRDRVWQATPPAANPLSVLTQFLFTSGRLYNKPLRTTALVALDFEGRPGGVYSLLRFSKMLNSWLFKGHFHFQALSSSFKMWSDGAVTPLWEDMDSTRALIAKDYEDVEGRLTLLNDPIWQAQFRKDWFKNKSGLAALLVKLGFMSTNFACELRRMTMDGSAIAQWDGQNLQDIYERLVEYQNSNGDKGSLNAEEKSIFESFPNPIRDDAEFFMHALRKWDRGFRWHLIAANADIKATKAALFNEYTLPGFNDSGAHLTNLAFYDGNLVTLKLAQQDSLRQESLQLVAKTISRLTREPAEFLGVDTGTLALGAVADIILIDPQALAAHDENEGRALIYREELEHNQMLNRSDGVVTHVWVAGQVAMNEQGLNPDLGKKQMGKLLRFRQRTIHSGN